MTALDLEFDLVVRGGTVVSERRSERLDIGVDAGRIAAIAPTLRGSRELDASGALILPGASTAGRGPPELGHRGRPAWRCRSPQYSVIRPPV